MNANIVGSRVHQARQMERITQAELAARLQLRGMKIDRAGVAKIERGLRQVSDVELVILSNALRVSAAWLLDEAQMQSGRSSDADR